MSAELVYRCADCLETHYWESDAKECCAPWPMEAWRCMTCDLVHDEEVDAELCCPEPNEHEDDCAA